jgi:hypothetical protein
MTTNHGVNFSIRTISFLVDDTLYSVLGLIMHVINKNYIFDSIHISSILIFKAFAIIKAVGNVGILFPRTIWLIEALAIGFSMRCNNSCCVISSSANITLKRHFNCIINHLTVIFGGGHVESFDEI